MAVGEVIDVHHGGTVGFLPGDHVDPFGNLLPLAFGFAAGASVRAGNDGVAHAAAIGRIDVVRGQAGVFDLETAACEGRQWGRGAHGVASVSLTCVSWKCGNTYSAISCRVS